MWVEFLTVQVAPRFFGVVLRIDIDSLRIPVVFFTSYIVAALKNKDSHARRGETVSKRSASCSRPDDDYIKMAFVTHYSLLQRIPAVTDSSRSIAVPAAVSGAVAKLMPKRLHQMVTA